MIEALKLALESLEANDQLINGTGTKGGLAYCMDGYYSDCFDVDPINKQTDEAIAAIKKTLAQPEQEPVADDFFRMIADRNPKPFSTPQRTWVGLTDDEMEDTFIQCGGKWNGDFWKIEDADFHPFLRTIEAKLKEKNT
jgi:hypothetical protein